MARRGGNDDIQDAEDGPVIARGRWLLIGFGVVTSIAVPNVTAETGFGPWDFEVTAAANHEFREWYGFPSGRACQEKRAIMKRDVALVMTARNGTIVGDAARRLHL